MSSCDGGLKADENWMSADIWVRNIARDQSPSSPLHHHFQLLTELDVKRRQSERVPTD